MVKPPLWHVRLCSKQNCATNIFEKGEGARKGGDWLSHLGAVLILSRGRKERGTMNVEKRFEIGGKKGTRSGRFGGKGDA